MSLSSAATSEDCIVAVKTCKLSNVWNERRMEILAMGVLAVCCLKEKKWDILPTWVDNFTFYEVCMLLTCMGVLESMILIPT